MELGTYNGKWFHICPFIGDISSKNCLYLFWAHEEYFDDHVSPSHIMNRNEFPTKEIEEIRCCFLSSDVSYQNDVSYQKAREIGRMSIRIVITNITKNPVSCLQATYNDKCFS